MKPTPSKFKLGLIQMSCGVGVDENLQKALSLIGQAAQRGAQIICLQELFRSQYFCQKQDATIFDLAEPIPGPSTEALAAVARQHQVVIVGSLFERRDAGVYHNTAVVLDADGSLLGTLPQDAHSRRSRCTSRSTTSRRAIRATAASTRVTGASACWFAGTSGIPKERG